MERNDTDAINRMVEVIAETIKKYDITKIFRCWDDDGGVGTRGFERYDELIDRTAEERGVKYPWRRNYEAIIEAGIEKGTFIQHTGYVTLSEENKPSKS